MSTTKIIIECKSHRRLLETLARDGVPSDAEVIYDKRNRLYALVDEGEKLCIKEFHTPGGINPYVYGTLRRSKARRSYEHALRLEELGFGTPAPVGYVVVRNGLALGRSYYVCAFTSAPYIRQWRSFDDRPLFVKALAHEMIRLMQKGVYHRDFSPGNILYERTERSDDAPYGFRFSYVDLNRMEFGVTSRRKLMQMFHNLAPHYDTTTEIAWQFALLDGVDPDRFTRDALRVVEGYLRTRRTKAVFKRLIGKEDEKF